MNAQLNKHSMKYRRKNRIFIIFEELKKGSVCSKYSFHIFKLVESVKIVFFLMFASY